VLPQVSQRPKRKAICVNDELMFSPRQQSRIQQFVSQNVIFPKGDARLGVRSFQLGYDNPITFLLFKNLCVRYVLPQSTDLRLSKAAIPVHHECERILVLQDEGLCGI
jgi:hypothetical protein